MLFGPTNVRHPSGCRASLFEHHPSCVIRQLLKFICSYLPLSCGVMRKGGSNRCKNLMQKLTSRKRSVLPYLFRLPQNLKNDDTGCGRVQLEEEISSNKGQLIMKLILGRGVFCLNRIVVTFTASCVLPGKTTPRMIDYLISLYKRQY